MTFYPTIGPWSTDDFNDATGAVFGDRTLQDITGGFITLVPTITGVINVVSAFQPVTTWNDQFLLASRASIIADGFGITGGLVPANADYTATGMQGNVSSAAAWRIYTPVPVYDSAANTYSGQSFQYLELTGESSFQSLSSVSSAQYTLEFTVAVSNDPYGPTSPLVGFSATGNNATSLDPLTGLVGHGLFLSTEDTNSFLYLECTRYGIRSFQDPRFTLPIDLRTPKTFRLTVNTNDIQLLAEDGKGLYLADAFTTSLYDTNLQALQIGAPKTDELYRRNITGIVGDTQWKNIRIATGIISNQNSVSFSGFQDIYSKTPVTLYTADFDPKISVASFASANVDFIYSTAGETTIVAQYSGATGWVDSSSSISLSGKASPQSFSLNSIPAYNYPRNSYSSEGISNPIRFKVTQHSTNGELKPSSIDSINVIAATQEALVRFTPNWTVVNQITEPYITIDPDTFYQDDPTVDLWTSFLVNTPSGLGATSSFPEQGRSGLSVEIQGSMETVRGGPYGTCLSTYLLSSGQAQPNSPAWSGFGSSYVTNYFLNPAFNQGFRDVTGETNYVAGRTNGQLAAYMYIPAKYNGQGLVTYNSKTVYKGTTARKTQEVQNVYVPAGVTHDGSIGVEAEILSGIASDSMLLSADIRITQGTGITVYVTGNGISNDHYWTVPGEYTRDFRTIQFPVNRAANISGDLRIGFTVPNGASSSDTYNYSIDNLSLRKYSIGYLTITGVPGYIHNSGTVISSAPSGYYVADRACTSFNTSLYLNSYPTGNAVLLHVTGQPNRGLKLSIDSLGYLTATFQTEGRSWADATGDLGFYTDYGTTTITSEDRLPIGRWSNIGFIHQVVPGEQLNTSNHSGSASLGQLAISNKAYLTFDGYPVASVDMMSGWISSSTVNADKAPVISYVSLSGACKATIASGISCLIDGIELNRAPIQDTEVEIAIKGARSTAPYFVPDSLFKSNYTGNLLITSDIDTTFGSDLFLGSSYNFAGPGYTMWDHGPLKNHLIFRGDIGVESISPYSGQGLNSTRFYNQSGDYGYGVAKYSSAFERLYGSSEQLGVTSALASVGLTTPTGRFALDGWIYPRTTGTFFTFVEDDSDYTKGRLQLSYNGVNLLVQRFSDANELKFEITGQKLSLTGWNYIGLDYTQTGYIDDGDSSYHRIVIHGSTGIAAVSEGIATWNGIAYKGNSADGQQAGFIFGYDCDCNLFNWNIRPVPANSVLNTGVNTTGSKGGRHQAIINSQVLFTGQVQWPSFSTGLVTIPKQASHSNLQLWVAAHNSYDNQPRYAGGINLHPRVPFYTANAYNIEYDGRPITERFGALDSPIRLGDIVPPEAVNLARINSEPFTVPNSINTIDISDTNPNNIASYRGGNYTISATSIEDTTASLGYRAINTGVSGEADLFFSGALFSRQVEVTTVSVTDIELSQPQEAYYYYLIGRGTYGVQVTDAFAHATGQLLSDTTGEFVDTYISNLERVKNSINLKNSKGQALAFNEFPYDIVTSPYKPNDLRVAAESGLSFEADGIGSLSSYTGLLPNTVFSVILITTKNRISPTDSVWVYYDGYNFDTGTVEAAKKEIVVPKPLVRETLSFETKKPGRFSVSAESIESDRFDLTFYGLQSGYSGQF